MQQQMMAAFLLLFIISTVLCDYGRKPVYTQVTFLYDIRQDQQQRPFQQDLTYFGQLLQTEGNLIIFGGKELSKFVWERRRLNNTIFIKKELESFKDLWYYSLAEKLRLKLLADPTFEHKEKVQFADQYYNPTAFSKLYLMAAALKRDKFNSDFYIWTDGTYLRQFEKNIVSPENIICKFYEFLQPQWLFITYPGADMFAGYQNGPSKYVKKQLELKKGVSAGNFGGYTEVLSDVKSAFENLLRITLENGDIGSEESVLTMMPAKYPYLFPTTVSLNFSNFESKLTVREKINRKPEYFRFFRGSFEDNGVIFVQRSITTGKKAQPISNSSIQTQKLPFKFYKSLLKRQALFLGGLIVVYIGLLFKKCTEVKSNSDPIPK